MVVEFHVVQNIAPCAKGQMISKCFLVSADSSKKQTKEFDLLPWRLVFVHFLEESEDTKKHFDIIWPLKMKKKKTLFACLQKLPQS